MESVELKVLKELKQKYRDFFEIKYIVGSFARGDFDSKSDIDIVYSLKDNIIINMDVFEIFNILQKIKQELEVKLNKKVDLIDESALNNIAKKYMKDKIYV